MLSDAVVIISSWRVSQCRELNRIANVTIHVTVERDFSGVSAPGGQGSARAGHTADIRCDVLHFLQARLQMLLLDIIGIALLHTQNQAAACSVNAFSSEGALPVDPAPLHKHLA